MSKTKIIFIAIFAGSIVAIALWNLNADRLQKDSTALRDYGANEIEKKESDISKVCFNKLQRGESEEVSEKCFNVETADTLEARAQGLMNREYLNPDDGMLFLFDVEAEYYFWMKNTLIPLDIIWLGKNKRVVFIKHNAQPCEMDPCETFGPDKSAKYVLEINSGLAKEVGLEKGDYLEFR